MGGQPKPPTEAPHLFFRIVAHLWPSCPPSTHPATPPTGAPTNQPTDLLPQVVAHPMRPRRSAQQRTFSPESLPTTRMSSPTVAPCGASGTSVQVMNCRRPGSNLMNPKSCTTAGKGRATEEKNWSSPGCWPACAARPPAEPLPCRGAPLPCRGAPATCASPLSSCACLPAPPPIPHLHIPGS